MVLALNSKILRSIYFTALITCGAQVMLASAANSATVYKKLDENGNLVFSDEPFEGAEAIDVKPVPTINLNIPQSLSTPTPATPTTPKAVTAYQSLSITSPQADSSLVNTGGLGTVKVSSQPALQGDHQYKLLINGEHKGTQSNNSFSLDNLFRGAHTAVVQIIKSNGEVVKVSSPVTFYVRQHSIKH